MVGFNTFENWKKGKFVLPETFLRNDNYPIEYNEIPSVPVKKIFKNELKLIQSEQREIGVKIRQQLVLMSKTFFLRRLKRTINQTFLIQRGINDLECILQGEISKRVLTYESKVFNFSLGRELLNSISAFYIDWIEAGHKENYNYIGSTPHLDELNFSAAQTWAYGLYDLLNWMRELDNGKLEEVNKYKKKKNFLVALAFADGRIYQWIDETKMSSRECARKLKLPTMHPYVRHTYDNERDSEKCIYTNRKLIRNVKEYCEVLGLEMDARFLRKL
jgi:hypothetical protein